MTRKTRIKTTILAAAGAALLASAVPLAAQSDAGAAPRDGGRVQMLFHRFDTDGDGIITRAEAEGAAAARFADADADGDGLLSPEELVAAAEARRLQRLSDRTARMVEELDGDGDGKLSAEEIAAGPGQDRLDRLFDRLDADADGAITEAEVLEMAKMRRGNAPWMRHGMGPHGGFDRF